MNLPAMQETWVPSLDQEDPLEKGMDPTPVFLPGESHGQRNLVGYSPRGCRESDTTKHAHTRGISMCDPLSPFKRNEESLPDHCLAKGHYCFTCIPYLLFAALSYFTDKEISSKSQSYLPQVT